MICQRYLELLLYFQLHLTAYVLYPLKIESTIPHNYAKLEIFWFTGYEQKLFCMQYLLVMSLSLLAKVITRTQTLTKILPKNSYLNLIGYEFLLFPDFGIIRFIFIFNLKYLDFH